MLPKSLLFIVLSFFPSLTYSCAATTPSSTPTTTVAPNGCTTCSSQVANFDAGIGTNIVPTQVTGTDANGCTTVTVTCTSPTAGTQVVLFWQEQGADRGTSTGTTMVSRVLTCNANGDLILTEPATGGMGIVDQVSCVSAA